MARALLALVLLAAAAAVNAQGANDLANLDFNELLGSPLRAVIQAQGLSSRTTMDFIQQVGFQPASTGQGNKAIMLEFNTESVDQTGQPRKSKIAVPLLSMIPLPYLVFEMVSINLNVQIQTTTTTSQQSSVASSSNSQSQSHGCTWWCSGYYSSSSSVSTQSRSDSSFTQTTQRTFSLKVSLQASQKEMPDGTAKVLHALLDQLHTQSSTSS